MIYWTLKALHYAMLFFIRMNLCLGNVTPKHFSYLLTLRQHICKFCCLKVQSTVYIRGTWGPQNATVASGHSAMTPPPLHIHIYQAIMDCLHEFAREQFVWLKQFGVAHCVACCHWTVCNSCLIKTVWRRSLCGVLLLRKVYTICF